ncbi:hypothetical protein QOZ80_6BG0486500 [Eleusine coracana subsp. coracana]|nr:hypothetical protein QOZ80_6BG0486500 [Eleusine coracana subsp. coracana]
MVGVGVAPPSPAGVAARLAARGVRPRRVSAKRSWPPGCGRFPAPPPPALAVAGYGENGVGGRANEAVAPAAVPPVAQNGALPSTGQDKVDAPAAAVPPAAQNGALPPTGQDKVDAPAAAVSPVAQNGALPQQGQNKVEEVAAAAAVSPAKCNGAFQHALPQQELKQMGEEGDRGENDKAGSLINGTDTASLDGQETEVAPPVVPVPKSNIVGASSSMQNGGEGAGLLVEEGHGISGDVSRNEATGDADGQENGNKPAEGELERKVDGVERSRKRWLMSALNPPPKRRAVSAVRRFPPGCGRTAVTTEGSGVSEVSPICTLPLGSETSAVATDGSRVLEVSPVRTFPAGCGRTAVTSDGIAVLEVSPIRAYPPGCGRTAVSTIGSGDEEMVQLGATTISNGDASAMEAVPALSDSGGSAKEKMEGKRVVGKGSTKEHNGIQESHQVASDTSPVDFVGTKQDYVQLPNVVTKDSPKHGFTEKMKGNIKGKHVAQALGEDKVRSKLDGSPRKDNFKTPTSHTVDANTKNKSSDGDKMNVMRKKTLSAKKESMPSNVIVKKVKFAHKPKGDAIGKNTLQQSIESKYGKHVTTNEIKEDNDVDLVPDQIIVQALMAPDKCPWTRGRKSSGSASKSLSSRKKLKGKDSQLPWKVASCKLANEDSYHEDDGNSRALVVYDEKREKREFSVNLPPSVPFSSHHGQSGDSDIDARTKVRKLLQKFQGVCRKLMQAEEQHVRNVGRIDLEAINMLKKDPKYTKPEAIVGNVPGVEVGDEFHFRVELSLVGLHRPYQGGIDTNKVNGVLVAISIVASGGYPDELSNSDELIYTGSGGKASGTKEAEDQKLQRGNLALKNCIETKTPVRVIHGFKGQSRGEVAHSKGKQVSTFTYDGLYNVVEYWQEGPKGSMVFKYKLQRIPGQPQLALHVVKVTKKSKVREGLLLPDISHGSERIPLCVINTIDGLSPAPFKYVTKIIYPPWYKKEPPTGCDCTNGCSDSVNCACAVKNGGEIPYNFNGAIVEAKPLIYECGPSCRCPPTCHNRVSQHGVKIPLEIFKTGNTGWGVRSLSSIPSGSFICEYAGELLEDKEAEKRENDEYLFDIGNNYQDEELWEGLKSIPGLKSSASSSKTMEGFTIDAAECGNVGRFINHSCSPNLYAQNVLWDHDDVEKPHVMFFAVENIPPLQELTYHYNYKIGQVQDKNGAEKVKHCYCGSFECSGRLY